MDFRTGVCRACRARFRIPSSFRSDHARCRECGGVVRVGPPGGADPADEAPARARRMEPPADAGLAAADRASESGTARVAPDGARTSAGPPLEIERVASAQGSAQAAVEIGASARTPGPESTGHEATAAARQRAEPVTDAAAPARGRARAILTWVAVGIAIALLAWWSTSSRSQSSGEARAAPASTNDSGAGR